MVHENRISVLCARITKSLGVANSAPSGAIRVKLNHAAWFECADFHFEVNSTFLNSIRSFARSKYAILMHYMTLEWPFLLLFLAMSYQ